MRYSVTILIAFFITTFLVATTTAAIDRGGTSGPVRPNELGFDEIIFVKRKP